MKRSGFTMIECLVVVIILGVLAAVVVFAVGGLSGTNGTTERIITDTGRCLEVTYDNQGRVVYSEPCER